MKSAYKRPSGSPLQLNMTSMIDVIFLLLIFFIMTANFNKLERLLPTSLFLPGSATASVKVPLEETVLGEIQIRVVVDGGKLSWLVNRRSCGSMAELDALLGELARVSRNVPVVIDPDREIAIEYVIDVYDACRRRGLTKIQFAARENVVAGGKSP